jgi:hypothetical protein
MNFQEILNDIKKLVFADQVPAPAPAPDPAPAVTEYKLKDGSVISIDKLEVGGIVTLNGEPAVDGEYQLESDQIVQVSGGVIVELSSPTEDTIPEEMKCLPAKMEALQVELSAAKIEVDELKKEINSQKEGFKMMFELVEKLAEAPTEAPAEDVKWEDMTPLQKFRALK